MTNYNLTLLQEVETVPDVISVANTYAGGNLVGMFLIAIFFVMLMIMKKWDFDKSLLVSSFLCFMFSLFLKMAGFVSMIFVLVFGIVMALTGFYLFLIKKD